MKPLTESARGMLLVGLALACALIGIAANVIGFTTEDSWFLSGAILGVLAMAVSIDDQRLETMPVLQGAERWLARSVMILALLCGGAGFLLGVLMDNGTRNLWSVMGLILALISISVAADSHRLAVARGTATALRESRDALAGVLVAALSGGLGLFGLITGLLSLPHSEAWLFGGVVFATVSVAFMFDEQIHVVRDARTTARPPEGTPPA